METVYCRPYHWNYKDRELDETGNKLTIDIWALDRSNNPVLLRVENFPVLCMLELPDYVNGMKTVWNKASVDLLMNELSYKLRGINFETYKLRYLNKIYFYKKNRYPILQCFFQNTRSMWEFKRRFDNQPITTKSFGTIVLRVWETDITPVRKLLTALNIKVCQWIKCQVTIPEEKISLLEREYMVSYNNIIGLSKEETVGWYTYPKLLVYDIECYTPKRGVFPNPLVVSDKSFLISCVIQRIGHPNTRVGYIILLGDCNDISEKDLPDCQIIKVDSEMKLIEEFCNIIKREDPEIISGYNINKFDIWYLDSRLAIHDREWPNFSRIPMETVKIKSTSWESRAFGEVSVMLFDCQGRITFDLYPFSERQFKLPKYDLDTVANHVLGHGKHDVSPQYMFDAYRQLQLALKSLDPVAIEKAKSSIDEVVIYCFKDSWLVIDIFEKTNVWVSSVEFASVSGINIQDLYVRGQQISTYSLIYNQAVYRGYIINHVTLEEMNMSGGFVREPIKGLHDNVFDLDFTSLYPSIIISNNMDYSTLVPKELNDYYQGEDFNVIEFDQQETIKALIDENGKLIRTKQIVDKHYVFKFYNKEVGIVPQVLKELLNERNKVKDEIKNIYLQYGWKLEKCVNEKEKADVEFKLLVLDKIQLAIKTRGNSVFGFFGAVQGRLPLVIIAACVTAIGRGLINQVDEFIAKKFQSQIIYNDTDSSFIKSLHIHPKDLESFGKKVAAEVSKLFPPPISMAYEKRMRMLCITKKKYACIPYDENGKLVLDRSAIIQRGIITARRDNCQFVRDNYAELLWDALMRTPVYYIIKKLYQEVTKLLDGQVKVENLVIIKKLGSNYKQDNYSMKIFADRMKALGRPIEVGERVGYLVVQGNQRYLGERMITLDLYQKQDQPGQYQIDYKYYLEKTMKTPIDQLINVVYGEELKHVMYQGPNNCKPVFLSEPIALICKMLKYNMSITLLEESIEELKPRSPRILRKKV